MFKKFSNISIKYWDVDEAIKGVDKFVSLEFFLVAFMLSHRETASKLTHMPLVHQLQKAISR
jgi:Leu/Phe-tRNA-protein transferase